MGSGVQGMFWINVLPMSDLREADGLVWVSCITFSAGPVILSHTSERERESSPIKNTT